MKLTTKLKDILTRNPRILLRIPRPSQECIRYACSLDPYLLLQKRAWLTEGNMHYVADTLKHDIGEHNLFIDECQYTLLDPLPSKIYEY